MGRRHQLFPYQFECPTESNGRFWMRAVVEGAAALLDVEAATDYLWMACPTNGSLVLCEHYSSCQSRRAWKVLLLGLWDHVRRSYRHGTSSWLRPRPYSQRTSRDSSSSMVCLNLHMGWSSKRQQNKHQCQDHTIPSNAPSEIAQGKRNIQNPYSRPWITMQPPSPHRCQVSIHWKHIHL